MMKIFSLFTLFSIYLQALCPEYRVLGLQDKHKIAIASQDAIVWEREDGSWSVREANVTEAPCKESGYLLLNNMEYKRAALYDKSYYTLKKGWNYLQAPKDGVDVAKTFTDVEFVYIYDRRSKRWAGYSLDATLMRKIKAAKILTLKYIEPHEGFYLLTAQAMRVEIFSSLPSTSCQRIMKSGAYELIYDSGIEPDLSYNSSGSVGVASRYRSHTRRGVYNDSRVLVMVPKLKSLSKEQRLQKYAPAIPKIAIYFNSAYRNKAFYVYDYLDRLCYKGYFPSKRSPPRPVLKKIQ